MLIENANLQFQLTANRGDCTRPKEECLRSNALTAAGLPRCLSSLRLASQFTVVRVSQSTCLSSEKVSVRAPVLTRSKRGHDGETAGMGERRKRQLTFSNSDSPFSSSVVLVSQSGKIL